MLNRWFNYTREKLSALHKAFLNSKLASISTHLYRISYHLSVRTFVCTPLLIVGTPILAIGLLFVDKNASSLPKWLKWFDNADEDGLIGDIPNQERNKARGIDPNGYLAKIIWLGFRNNLNYFKYRILGLKVSDIDHYTAIVEKPHIPNEFVGDYRSGGVRYIEVELKNGTKRYEYYIIWPYHLLNYSLCFRARIGWKIGNPNEPDKKRTYYEWACSINPFKHYQGKWPPQNQLEEKAEYPKSHNAPERPKDLLSLELHAQKEPQDFTVDNDTSPSHTPYYHAHLAQTQNSVNEPKDQKLVHRKITHQ